MTMFDEQEISASLEDDRALALRIIAVIPTLNEATHIRNCLLTLVQGSDALTDVQIIVADGGSSDGTQDIVNNLHSELPNISLINNPGRVQAAGINAGARMAEYGRDILVRCDAHADYPPAYILQVAKALETAGSDSLVVPMDAQGTTCFQKANAWIVDTPLGSGGSAHRGGRNSGYVDHGHHAAFRLVRFLELGGYDESFSHNEDAEYDIRLHRADGSIYLDTDIRIGYYPRESSSSLWRQYFGYGKGRARNLIKNQGRPRLRQMIPVANLLLLLSSVLLAFLYPGALAWPALYVTLLLVVSLWFVAVKKSLCGAWCGIALGVMHIAWGAGFITGVFSSMKQRQT